MSFSSKTLSKQLYNQPREVVFTLQNKHIDLGKSMLCHVETDILTNESTSQGKHIYLQMTKRLKIRDSQEILCNVFVHPLTSIQRILDIDSET